MTKKTKTQPAAEILGRATLVTVRMGVWEARKHDADVTRRLTDEMKADPNSARVHKHILGGSVPELGQVLTAATQVRKVHEAQTVPWSDDGWRCLPTANYFSYLKAMREAIANFMDKVETFVGRYRRLVREAEERLGPVMYRKADYPSVDAVRAKYYAHLDFAPVPADGDFRVELPQEEMTRLADQINNRRQVAVKAAMAEVWQRLGEVVTELRDRLDDGKYLRPSMVDRVREVAETLGRLNLTDDPALEQARKAALRDLATIDVAHLRDNKPALTEKAAAADAILQGMKGFWTAPKKG